MTNNCLLSICIPTFNFGSTIGDTLDSILKNDTENIEIIILDGGSTDNTSEIVRLRQEKFPRIFYFNQGYKGGIDRDIAKAVSYANGKYCWIFSADDCMKISSIDRVLTYLHFSYDIYLCEQSLCDNEMNIIKEHPIFNNIISPQLFDLSDPNYYTNYFQKARTTEAFFSYLAGPIFKKELWDRSNQLIPDEFNSTCWGIAGRLMFFFPDKNLKIFYLAESLIKKRAGIDSFMDKGVVNRLKITIDGFVYISNAIFGQHSFETKHIRRVIRNEEFFSLKNLLSIKVYGSTNDVYFNLTNLNELVFRHYKNSGLLNYLKYIFFRLMSKNIYFLIRNIYKFVIK